MDAGLNAPPKSVLVAQNVAVRTGAYVGLSLSLILLGWILFANRVAIPAEYVRERNLATAALLGLVGLIPVMRFLLQPAKLWISSLIAWTVFSVAYCVLSVIFSGLREHFSAFQVFLLGTVTYMIVGTVAWLGNIIGRTWAAHSPRGRHPVS
jgi:hypothetical protein